MPMIIYRMNKYRIRRVLEELEERVSFIWKFPWRPLQWRVKYTPYDNLAISKTCRLCTKVVDSEETHDKESLRVSSMHLQGYGQ